MSRPSSQSMAGTKGIHTRNMSNASAPQDPRAQRRGSVLSKPEIHYTAFIRLPFARGDFVDPPQVDWNATKDRALWKIISRSPKTADLDWEDLALKFQVSQAFMLQQAAWLYERHLTHVRAQMKKVGGSNTTATGSGGSSHTVVGGIPMKRPESGGSAASRTPSALSIRLRDSPIPRGDTSTPGTPRTMAPPLSRNPSTNTVTQSRAHIPAAATTTAPRSHLQRSFRSSFPPPLKSTPPVLSPPPEPATNTSEPASPTISALSSSSSSESSEDDTANPLHRSQLFKRPPRFRAQKPRGLATLEDEDHEGDDEDDSGAFLPFAQTERTSEAPRKDDPSATLRDTSPLPERVPNPKYLSEDINKAPVSATHSNLRGGSSKGKGKAPMHPISSSATSSASDAPHRPSAMSPHALSPRHRAELARLSPRRSASGTGGGKREGSDGTPSMGSSFSDLDDASITQSALEEALLSNMQHGRMSTLSQLRSRYL
ncbi:uncharacterized protein BDZ99DRAFT_525044 [Mytilinidion resinicola]|uniref:Autophagy-related protein 29 n=1 Tax=Mytilinidion resinicola TaxID=574789 RepID=A0A6A6Y944_9PEZI|nr:uncharacterized protein BDZ99DRAFT_525044 [Mytilinidion resinicola]KAF2805341.1 hypothetical protein BDZ99DRAFT_525044 [Mytilinidion resinicola]